MIFDFGINLGLLAAFGTAVLWAITPLISVTPSTQLGSIGFARWRMYTAVLMMLPLLLLRGDIEVPDSGNLQLLFLSGFIGIFFGDTLLFASMNILGPRRAAILFASNAAMSAVLAVVFLGETVSPVLAIAFTSITIGVMSAIFFGRHRGTTHLWELDRGSVALGIGFGLVAALCQALGSILSKPVMDSGVDPMMAATIRLAAAACAHTALLLAWPKLAKNKHPITMKSLGQTAATSFIAMVAGMTLLMFALANGDVSWVSIISSISPILILPMLWVFFAKPPPLGAWFGAILTVIGTALIVMNT